MPSLPTTTSPSNQGRRRPIQRRVSFGTVSVREFERVLDVNPACSCGPSLSIGWRYSPKKDISIEDWEDRRSKKLIQKLSSKAKNEQQRPLATGQQRKKSIRRSLSDLVLSKKEREQIALQLGYKNEDIQKNIRHIEKEQFFRQYSIHGEKLLVQPDMNISKCMSDKAPMLDRIKLAIQATESDTRFVEQMEAIINRKNKGITLNIPRNSPVQRPYAYPTKFMSM